VRHSIHQLTLPGEAEADATVSGRADSPIGSPADASLEGLANGPPQLDAVRLSDPPHDAPPAWVLCWGLGNCH
jgi:hypothetical protein